ncbi:MAG: tyrosine-type recombinase/integrase [Terriglobia bacterium]
MGYLYKQKGSVNWWIKYYRNGRPIRESTGTPKETQAKDILKLREGDVARGLPVNAKMGRVKIDELLEDLRTEYKVNGRRTLADLEGRCKNHLIPFFGGRKAAHITTADVNRFVVMRQETGATNAEINRELSAFRRAFSLAHKGGKLLHKPYIPALKENNVRQGFFEREQFEAVRRLLSSDLQPVATFAYVTGWRTRSEILTLQWNQVDFVGGVVRLNAGTTKNDEGRVFPFLIDEELTALLIDQKSKTERLQKELGIICPWVFHRSGTNIRDFRGAWEKACIEAGLPGRLVHDFRRTAVRNLERAGVSRSVAMKLTGHKTESVYRRYAIVSESDLSDAVTKLQALKNLHSKTASGIVTGIVAQKKSKSPLHN